MDLLVLSRWISVSATILTIIGTFLLGSRLFGNGVGLLAASLLALSPLVLHSGKDALTQGDALAAAAVVFTLLAYDRFEARRTTLSLFVFSILLGMAIASKFFLVVLIPGFALYQGIWTIRGGSGEARRMRVFGKGDEGGSVGSGFFLRLTLVTGLLVLSALIVSIGPVLMGQDSTGEPGATLARVLWLVSLIGILLCFVSSLRESGYWPYQNRHPSYRWHLGGYWLAVLPLAFTASLALFPAHLFNPHVLPVLLDRFFTMDGSGGLFTATTTSAKLYLGLLLFKLGLPFGIATLLSLCWAAVRSVKERSLLLLVSQLVFYGALLAVLPLQQPFWLMSVYPIITLTLAAWLVRAMEPQRKPQVRLSAVTFLAFSLLWLGVGIVQVFPTFGLYGYETIGETWMGGDSRGYRAVVTVTNDGSTEAFDWLQDFAPQGSTVLYYLNDFHIVRHLNEKSPKSFDFVRLPPSILEDAMQSVDGFPDFAVVRAIDDLDLPSPEGEVAFHRVFGTRPAFEIFRGRSRYRMPVIRVYRRVSPEGDTEVTTQRPSVQSARPG